MKLETIPKQEIPSWDYGDVVIKKFSFADKIRMAGFVSNVSVKKNIVETKDIDIVDTNSLGLYTFAAGIHSVKDKDNYEFELKPHTHIDEKIKFISGDSIEYESGEYLLNKIKEFNQENSEELKKK